MVIPYHGVISIHTCAGDNHGFSANLPQPVNQIPGLFLCDAVLFVRHPGQVHGFRVVGHDIVRNFGEPAHMSYGLLRNPIIEFSLIPHDGIHENQCPVPRLLPAILRDYPCLKLRHNKTSRNRVKTEPQFLPYANGIPDVTGCL